MNNCCLNPCNKFDPQQATPYSIHQLDKEATLNESEIGQDSAINPEYIQKILSPQKSPKFSNTLNSPQKGTSPAKPGSGHDAKIRVGNPIENKIAPPATPIYRKVVITSKGDISSCNLVHYPLSQSSTYQAALATNN